MKTFVFALKKLSLDEDHYFSILVSGGDKQRDRQLKTNMLTNKRGRTNEEENSGPNRTFLSSLSVF
jgi:hypothetical protein